MDIDSPLSSPPSPPFLSSPSSHEPLILPPFSAHFPLPFRVLSLIGFAILLWAINLHVLSWLGIDTSWALGISEEEYGEIGGEEEIGLIDLGLTGQEVEEKEEDRGGEISRSIEEIERERERNGPSLPPQILDLTSPFPPSSSTSPPSSYHDQEIHRQQHSLRLNSSRPRLPPSALYPPIYRLFLLYTAWVLSGYLIFRYIISPSSSSQTSESMLSDATTDTNHVLTEERMETWYVRSWIAVVLIGVGVGVGTPWRGVGDRWRRAFLRSLHRILLPRLSQPPYFSDVILADILTSFAKVLGDCFVSVNQLWLGGISRGRVRLEGWGQWIVLGMVCLPYLLRFQQCLFEYLNPHNKASRPLLNALKYSSAFPVIILSAMQRNVIKEVAAMKGKTVEELVKEGGGRWFGEHRLFRLWLLAVIVNSMYSFYWDVTNDWGLCLLTPSTWAQQSPLLPGSATSASATFHNSDSNSRILHARSGSRSNIKPMFLTRLFKWLKPFGYEEVPGAAGMGSATGHRLSEQQRSPFPSPGVHGRSISSSGGGSVAVDMTDLDLKKGGLSEKNASNLVPNTSTTGPFSYIPASSTITTSLTTSTRPLLTTRYFTIPNPLYLGLRSTLLFPDPLVYHLFICIDFILRFIWSLKLSSHLHTISEIESGVFLMEGLELLRRWMWVFLRIEWEIVKKMEEERRAKEGMGTGTGLGLGAFADGNGTGSTADGVGASIVYGGRGHGQDPSISEPTSPRRRSGGRGEIVPMRGRSGGSSGFSGEVKMDGVVR